MKLHVSKDPGELSDIVAGWIVNYAKEVLAKHNRFTIALSGGSTPKKLYEQLASEKYRSKINWKLVHVFWGDERVVPFSDNSNNARMAFDELLSHVPIPKDQIHIMQTDIDPVDAAAAYEQLLHNYFDKQLYTFDLVLLGLGDNSHTLSLFPGYDDIVFDMENWVRSFYLKEQDMFRITLTSAIVNTAGRIAFLVAGKDKSEAMRQVVSGKYDPANHPAQLIRPLNGELYWFTDKAAASDLQHVTSNACRIDARAECIIEAIRCRLIILSFCNPALHFNSRSHFVPLLLNLVKLKENPPGKYIFSESHKGNRFPL